MNKNFIFVTTEGSTFQPNSDYVESEYDNLQVVGFSKGDTPDKAFEIFLKENKDILKSNFDEIICWQLSDEYDKIQRYYYLNEYKSVRSDVN